MAEHDRPTLTHVGPAGHPATASFVAADLAPIVLTPPRKRVAA